MKNEKLTNYAVIDMNTGEVGQYLTTKEKDILENRYTSANPTNDSKINDGDCRKNSDLFYQYINETCGNFYFNYYDNINYSQYIFRFISLYIYELQKLFRIWEFKR